MLLPASASKETTLRHGQDSRHRPGAGAVRKRARRTSRTKPRLTAEGVLLGTPDYMAPEQARDARTADIRADIYSLGCVLYHLLAGQPPFPDTNIISQMIRHATEPARPLKEFNPAVPDGLQQIVNWMMAKDPGQRYPTPERAAQALQVFLAAGVDRAVEEKPDAKMQSYLSWLEMQIPADAVGNIAAGRAAVAPCRAAGEGCCTRGNPPNQSRLPNDGLECSIAVRRGPDSRADAR